MSQSIQPVADEAKQIVCRALAESEKVFVEMMKRSVHVQMFQCPLPGQSVKFPTSTSKSFSYMSSLASSKTPSQSTVAMDSSKSSLTVASTKSSSSSKSSLAVDSAKVRVTHLTEVTGFVVDLNMLVPGKKDPVPMRIECPKFKPSSVRFDGVKKDVV